ncbi:hypothetical protein FHS91_001108 [Sphingobium xanthum]
MIGDRVSDPDFIRTIYAPLMSQFSGSARVGEKTSLCVVLSGQTILDQWFCEVLNKVMISLGKMYRCEIRADVFGLTTHPSGSWKHLDRREWSDLTGFVSSAWLVINRLQNIDECDQIAILARAHGAPIALSSAAAVSNLLQNRDVDRFHSVEELEALISVSYGAKQCTAHSYAQSDIADFSSLLRPYVEKLTAGEHVGALAKNSEAFLFNDATPLRVSPLVTDPALYFVPATGLLNVQAMLRRNSGANEIRIFDMDGRELGRIVPSQIATRQPVQQIDGGIILHGIESPPDLNLRIYASGRFVHSMMIECSAIDLVHCELASLSLSGEVMPRIDGTVWSDVQGAAVELRLPADRRIMLPPATSNSPSHPLVNSCSFSVLTPQQLVPGSAISTHVVAEDGDFARTAIIGRAFEIARAAPPHPLTPKRDQHRGARAWMIGNGPSVRLEDLDKIADQGDIIFCFNRFYLAYEKTRLRENYVVSADTLMIEDFGQEMIDLSTGIAHFCLNDHEGPAFKGDFARLRKMDVAMPIFCPDIDKCINVGGSSVFVALQIAYFYGIRDVLLYGMDYSFSHTPVFDPKYPMPVSYDDNNHFIAGYRSHKPWCPPNWRDISFGFLKSRIAFEADGGRVRNATRGGKLETFERVDIDEILAH